MSKIGDVNYNKFGSKMEIIAYRTAHNIDVYFEEYNWIAKNRKAGDFRLGKIKCPYEPRVCNIGYNGEGKYNATKNNKKTECYKTWKRMLERCYDGTHPAYEDVTVCKEWHNFQNFAKWYEENYYTISNEKVCLDKDILSNNKIYSPSTCIFVPEKINLIFSGGFNGVTWEEKYNKWMVRVWVDGKRKYLGLYNNYDEAFQIYKKEKEKYMQNVIISYKNIIPQYQYNILYNIMYDYNIKEVEHEK